MKHRATTLLGLTLTLLLCFYCRADQPAAGRNAALVLRPLFERYRDELEKAGYPDVVALYAPTSYDPPTQEQVDVSKAFLRDQARPLTVAFIAASRIEHCDWEIDAAQGPNARLFHLGDARIVAQLLCADARVRFDDNDPAGAAEDYAAILRLARQARGTDVFIVSSMSEASIAVIACKGIQRALDDERFDPIHKQILLQELVRFDPNDPHHLRDAVVADSRMLIDWLRRAYQPGKTKAPEMREYVNRSQGSDKGWENAKQLQALMERGEPLEPMLVQLQSFHDAVLAAWDGPIPTDALRVRAQEAEAGKYGAIAALIFPRSMASVRDTHDNAVATFALLRKRLAQ